jgi:hypothetical protein
MSNFVEGGITLGWSREPNTKKWIEVDVVAGVTPELEMHDVADNLNVLEENLLKTKVKMLDDFLVACNNRRDEMRLEAQRSGIVR